MPRYIDADALIRDVCGHYCGCEPEECGYTDHEPWRECLHVKRIINAPTVSPDEVRGVVHCGECSHADKDLPGAIYCTMWDAWEVPEDGFCYKGAKMEVTSDEHD